MAITYLLAPIPKWVIMNNQGEVAPGAKLYTYRNLNKTQQKPVYQDPQGSVVYTNPIVFDANGTEGPFYWSVDSDHLDDTYYLEAYDNENNLLWTIENYFPPGEGGGGGGTTYIQLTNYIANNVFIEHVDNLAATTTNSVICPSNHAGFTPAFLNPVVGTYGVVGPDIRFVKNNTAAIDNISFVNFLSAVHLTGDTTPIQYVRYECTNSPVGETYKCFQFPIVHQVGNLANQEMTFSIWARVNITPATIELFSRQYFGSGSPPTPSAEVRPSQGTMALTSTWQKFSLSVTIPNVDGKTLGPCGDDALYLQLQMPLGQPCDIFFTKPSFYLGTIDPSTTFETYDQIDSVTQTPRSGDMKYSMIAGSIPPGGWLPYNEALIGSPSSISNYPNLNTFPLYKTLWDGVHNIIVSGGKGASAIADYSANKTLLMGFNMGRVTASQNSIFSSPEAFSANPVTDILTVADATPFYNTTPVLVSNVGGSLPSPLIANIIYYVNADSATTLKIANSADHANEAIFIDITTSGSGTNTLIPALGYIIGEGFHTLTTAEMPAHSHDTAPGHTGFVQGTIGGPFEMSDGDEINLITFTSNTGGNEPHNTMQPTFFASMFIKL